MRKTLLLITMMTASVALGTVITEPTVKRLDGSTIAPAEIDAMRAAEVTGVGRTKAGAVCGEREQVLF